MADVDGTNVVELIHKFEASVAKEKNMMTLAGNECTLESQELDGNDRNRLFSLPNSGFTAMMTSPMFDILDDSQRSVCQDMNQPLSHYYIASSHNT